MTIQLLYVYSFSRTRKHKLDFCDKINFSINKELGFNGFMEMKVIYEFLGETIS